MTDPFARLSGAGVLAFGVLAFYLGLLLPWLVGRVRRWWHRDYESSMRVITELPRPKRRAS